MYGQFLTLIFQLISVLIMGRVRVSNSAHGAVTGCQLSPRVILSSTQIETLQQMFDTRPIGLTEVQSGFHLAAIVGATKTLIVLWPLSAALIVTVENGNNFYNN